MGIIRLTLLTIAGILAAMFYFGRDADLPEDRIGRERAAAPSVSSVPPFAPRPAREETPVVTAPEPTPEPARTTRLPEPARPAPVAAAPVTPVPDLPETDATIPGPLESAIAAVLAEPEPEPVAEPEPAAEPEPGEDGLRGLLYVTGDRVNVRAGPATVYGVVTSLTRGTAVIDAGDAGEGWRMIRLQTGELAYMSADFLSAIAP